MKYFFTLILSIGITFSFAQSGNFFLSHYSPNKDRLDNVCFQMAQQKDGIMYFATRSGLLNFDGRNWDLINGKGAVYTIQVSHEGAMFWGGSNGYGVVNRDTKGLPELKMLSDKTSDIFQSLLLESNIYFLNEDTIVVMDVASHRATSYPASEVTGQFNGIFELDGQAVINAANGVFKLAGNQLVEANISFLKNTSIVFTSKLKSHQLVCNTNNELYIMGRSRSPQRVRLEDQSYLDANVVTSGSFVNDDLVVLGTLRGGMIFINLTNGNTHEIINYATGLPDNEVFTLVTDQDQSVWAAHEYGFTRISPYLPFRSFSHYPGLSGNLLCAISFKNSVYVGTSLGLFKLEKEDIYHERLFYETVGASEKTKKSPAKDQEPATKEGVSQEPSKKKGFWRLFRRKESAVETQTTDSGGALIKEPQADRPRRNQRIVARAERVLVTSNFRYNKVSNINAKITQLLAVKGRLLACGLEGTLEINGQSAKVLYDGPTRYMYVSKDDILFLSTYSDEIKTFRFNGKSWDNLNLLQNLNDQITNIFSGKDRQLWLCGLDKIYRLVVDQNDLQELEVVEIENPNYDEFVGTQVHGNTLVANASGFYQYNVDAKTFERIDSLSADQLVNYFSFDKSIWYKHSHGWNQLGERGATHNLGLLNLFSQIRFITPDTQSDNLWVITDDNELFKYFADRINVVQKSYPLQLKTVKNGDQKLGRQRVLDIDQDNSRLTFEVVQPDYLASDAIEYRYHITGLEQGWTEWSQANNVIEIPYLPSGEYSLEVESKDIFGKQSSMEKISLQVLPPYWKRPWFYALEVLLFSLSVIASFRLSTRYRIISRLLMLLTIIMLIQFVETIIGQTLATTTSPVIDFVIQVVIAMLVLPIEGYLRELMLRSLDTSNRFYRFIAPKTIGSKPDSDVE